jgi:hypothetical protein
LRSPLCVFSARAEDAFGRFRAIFWHTVKFAFERNGHEAWPTGAIRNRKKAGIFCEVGVLARRDRGCIPRKVPTRPTVACSGQLAGGQAGKAPAFRAYSGPVGPGLRESPADGLTQKANAGRQRGVPIAIAGAILSWLPLSGGAALLGIVAIVLRDMGLHGLFGVASGVNYMAHRDVSMMCCGFVVSSLVMLGGFLMMKRRMLQVFRNLFVVSSSLLRHSDFLQAE